ncbi:AAA family ATPase [Nocardia sp. NPDC051052]|uniref:MinD/ParA family ATP-binding protein n=1 Tax=Nocardia sp. NPDC051052 TaxID=3364322 RepID=UPI0037887A31
MSRNNDGLPMLPPWLSESDVTQVGYEAPVQNLPSDDVIEEGPSRRRGRPEKRGRRWGRDKNNEQPAEEQQPAQRGRAPEPAPRAPEPAPRGPEAPQPDSPRDDPWRQPGLDAYVQPRPDDAWQAGPPQRTEPPAARTEAPPQRTEAPPQGLPTRNPGPPPPAFQPLGRRTAAESPASDDLTTRHRPARPDLPPPPALPDPAPQASTAVPDAPPADVPQAPAERSAPPESAGPPPWLAGPRPEQPTTAPAEPPRRPPLPDPPPTQGNPPVDRSAAPPADQARLDAPTRGADAPPQRGPEPPVPSREPQTPRDAAAAQRPSPATPPVAPDQNRTPGDGVLPNERPSAATTPEPVTGPQGRVPDSETEHGAGATPPPGTPPNLERPSRAPAASSTPPTGQEHGPAAPGDTGPLDVPQRAHPDRPAAEQAPNGTAGPQPPAWLTGQSTSGGAERPESGQPQRDPGRQAPDWVPSSNAGTARTTSSGRHRLPSEIAAQQGAVDESGRQAPQPNDFAQPPAGPYAPGGPAGYASPTTGGQAPGSEQPGPPAPAEPWRNAAAPVWADEPAAATPPTGGQAPGSERPGPQAPGEPWRIHTAPASTGETAGQTPPFVGGQVPGGEQRGPQAPGEPWRNQGTPAPTDETAGRTPPFVGGQAPGGEQRGPQAPGQPWRNQATPAPTDETAGRTPPFAGGQAPGSEQVGPQQAEAPLRAPGGFAGPQVGGQAPGGVSPTPPAPPGQWGRPPGQFPPGGQNQPGVQYQSGPPPSLDDVPMRRAKKSPGTGWRKAVHHVSGGAINPGLSAEEMRLQELVARIRQPVRGDYRIATLSLKGGVGKTTTTMGIGSIFASIRGDRVIAVDANPDFGTLSQRVPLQTRSTVRDLLLDPSIQRYSDVRRHTSQATSRLEVLASERDPAASEAFSEEEYRAVARILQRFYNIILTDCGTGLMHSAMSGVLDLAHSLVLISSPAIDGARSAAATLDWLSLHGHDHLVRNAVVVINSPRAGSPNVGIQQLREYFLSRCRAVHIIPFDPHMSEGAEIDLHRLHKQTKRAYVELAATIADDFATDHRRYQP